MNDVIVIRHTPEPVPPATFDITGLSRDQLLGLHALLGGTTGSVGYKVHSAISEVLRADSSDIYAERAKRFPDLTGKGSF